jgi:hypothetical protein
MSVSPSTDGRDNSRLFVVRRIASVHPAQPSVKIRDAPQAASANANRIWTAPLQR